MGKFETKFKVGFVILIVLTLLGLVPTIIGSGNGPIWSVAANILMYVLVFIYAIWGYKKPHGNMLKLLMLLFALSQFASVISTIQYGEIVPGLVLVLAILIIGYITGRLDRVKENKALMFVVFILLGYEYIRAAILLKYSFFGTMGAISPLILWIDLCFAYLLRYKQHKLAGLMDAPTATEDIDNAKP